MHIDTSYDPIIPSSSPIGNISTHSGEFNALGHTEKILYHKKAISLLASVSIGDTLLALATNVNTQDQLRVVIRYLMGYCQAPAIGEIIIQEALKIMKEESTDNINEMGGSDSIVERVLEHHFGEVGETNEEPSITPERDYEELNYHLSRIKDIDLLLNGVRELYQDPFITK